ncbi:MAG: hypothetical protein A2033_16070 [Bacteroidetes bacterium GWA2_31_9]|nr:MAG: hypothetical protein A2033_16070 [Bacteroidetes bacterium GWA2_31_9]
MKNFKITFLVFVLFVQSCTEETTETQTLMRNKAVIIFLDKSDSPHFTAKSLNNLRNKLINVVSENLNMCNDKLAIYFIHENTSSCDLYQSFKISSTLPSNFSQLNPEDKERAKRQLQNNLEMEKQLISKVLLTALELPANKENQTTNGSDIWGSLHVCHKFFSETDSSTVKHVYYVSDMLECMPNTVNFYKKMPESNPDAIEIAKQDCKLIMQMWPELKDTRCFAGLEVNVFIPREALDDDKSVSRMEYYWKTIFEKFGATYKQN